MGGPFAEHPVRLAAAAGAAEENLEHRARQQGRLRARLRFPPDGVRSGGVLAIRDHCFSFAPGTYSACHSSRVAETAGARMTVGREISPECSTEPAGCAFRIRFTCTTIRYSINDSARRGYQPFPFIFLVPLPLLVIAIISFLFFLVPLPLLVII